MKKWQLPFNFNGKAQPLFVKGDIDGFFGLAIDNLIQFLLIFSLCKGVLGFSEQLILTKILPGAAVSILIGNIFYSYLAQKLSAKTGRSDVTALPYGINTVSLFAYIFLVMLPVKLSAVKLGLNREQAAQLAWQIGLVACFFSGIIEFLGAFIAEKIRKFTPRAALLSTLAGIAISFIAIDFAIRTYENPILAMLPLAVILTTYFSKIKMPLHIPGGAWAVLLGTVLAWGLYAVGLSQFTPVTKKQLIDSFKYVGLYFPMPVIGDLIAGLKHPLTYTFFIPVILPMGLFNVLGSLQNIESAEAAGDPYPTLPSLATNGIGSIAASLFGSAFPTTIYIGHPGWKGLGARSGYSILNGIFFTIVALLGLISTINALIPLEAGMAIVLWIGIIITAQAFQATEKKHAPAVAVGLFPAIAAWGLLIATQTLNAAGNALSNPKLAAQILNSGSKPFLLAGLHLDGLLAISQGFMITCMVWSAASVNLIEQKFSRAALWMGIGLLAAFFGFTHAGTLTPAGGVYQIGLASGWKWALGYGLSALFFIAMQLWHNYTQRAKDR